MFLWLRGLDLNQRPPGYELPSVSPSAAPQCFLGLLGPEIAPNPKVVPLRSTGILPCLGHRFGSAEKAGLAKESGPLFDYFTAPGLDDPQDIPQHPLRNLGVVVAQQALPPPFVIHTFVALADGAPSLHGRGPVPGGHSRWPRSTPNMADFKDLRHSQASLPSKLQNQVGGRFNYFLIPGNFLRGEKPQMSSQRYAGRKQEA